MRERAEQLRINVTLLLCLKHQAHSDCEQQAQFTHVPAPFALADLSAGLLRTHSHGHDAGQPSLCFLVHLWTQGPLVYDNWSCCLNDLCELN